VQLGRLLNNPRVTSTEMVATARADLLGRVAGRHVLAIQDSTSLRDDGRSKSLQLHPTIAVDGADGALWRAMASRRRIATRAAWRRRKAAAGWMPPLRRPICWLPARLG